MASIKQIRHGRARSPGRNLVKVTLPRLSRVYSRLRLIELCDQLISHKLVWIAAPAGSGKTTLMVDYLRHHKRTYLWYQIDAGDQDIASFFNNLADAAERSSRTKRKLTRFTPEYALGLPAFCRNFFRDLFARLKAPACIVFDNYQDVGENSVLDGVLGQALDELPDGITLIALSRTGLPAALARHDAGGQVSFLDAATLSLTADEETMLVKLTLGERRLKPDDLARLHQVTHGWMAGWLLALREVRGHPVGEEASVIEAMLHAPAQDPAHIFNYFATEVMQRLEPATREFLYAVALLPSMSTAMCEQLTGNPNARAILQRLVHEHFFTNRRGLLTVSYEFHPLFRQFLLAQANSHLDHAQLLAFKRRTGQLLAEAGESENAVALVVACEDWATLAELIRAHGAELEQQGRHLTLQQWIAALPEAECSSDPWLLYWNGIAQMPTDPFRAYDLFDLAYPQFSHQDDALGLYLCWIGAATALFFRHDDMNPAPGWVTELERLRERHPKWPSLEVAARVTTAAVGMMTMGHPQNPALPVWVAHAERIYRHVPVGTVRCFVGYQLAVYYMFFGHIDKMSEVHEQLKPLIVSPKISAIAKLLANVISIFFSWQTGNLAAANEAIIVGIKLVESSGVYATSQWFFASVAMLKMSFFEVDEATEFVERLREGNNPRQRMELAFLEFMAGWRDLVLGDVRTAKTRTVSALTLIEPLHNIYFLMQALGANAQVYIELGEFSNARCMLDRLRRISTDSQNQLFAEYFCYYLEAYLLDKSGGCLDETLQALRHSFTIAAQHQWLVMIFWQPSLMARLCVLALQHHIEPDYTRRLIHTYHLIPPASGEPVEQWPWPVRIYTLDRFAVQVSGKPLSLDAKGQKKPFELLKVIVAYGGRDVPLARIFEALWPDAEGDTALRNFTITLHRLRQFVGSDSVIFAEQRLSLDAQRVWVDLWLFERRLNDLENLLVRGDTTRFNTLLAEICGRYRRPFLDGEDEVWAVSRRERIRHKWLRVLEAGAVALARANNHDAVVICCERGLEIEPLSENLYRMLMKSQIALGEHAAAATAYRRCLVVLQRELGVAPSTATEALYRQVPISQKVS